MCNPAVIPLITAAVSAYGQYQQGQATKQIGRNNQIMAEYAAQDAQRRGEEEAIKVRRQADQLKGRQRALMSARGLDLGAGTPADILDQTDFFSQQDVNTTRNNAAREAWGYRAQGANYRAQGDFAAQQANLGAFSTVLSSAGQAASKWSQYGGSGNSFNGTNDFKGVNSGNALSLWGRYGSGGD